MHADAIAQHPDLVLEVTAVAEALMRRVRDRYDYGSCSLEVDRIAESHLEIVGGLSLDFAPDFLHNQNISGGPAYAVELPARNVRGSVDPDVMFEPHRMTLVGYLREAFAWGGFPLLAVAALPLADIGLNERVALRGAKGPWGPPAERLRAKLCRDLIAF